MIFRREHGPANVATVIERKTRFTVLFRNNDRRSKPIMARCKCWIKFPRKCWRKIPHLAGLAISRACDGRLRFSGVDRDVWAAAAV